MMNHLKEGLGGTLLALGITVPVSDFIGGMLFALSASFFALIWSPERDRKDFVITLTTAAFLATVAALLHPIFFASWPLQLLMCATGFFTRFITLFLINFGTAFSKKGGSFADMISGRFGVKDEENDSK